MQELIVLSIAIAALVYLVYKFIAKPKSHNCDKCGLSDNESTNH
ncbi:MAG: FeoB-associated Cys-rich membrane protein [Vicingaceae bacterium]